MIINFYAVQISESYVKWYPLDTDKHAKDLDEKGNLKFIGYSAEIQKYGIGESIINGRKKERKKISYLRRVGGSL